MNVKLSIAFIMIENLLSIGSIMICSSTNWQPSEFTNRPVTGYVAFSVTVVPESEKTEMPRYIESKLTLRLRINSFVPGDQVRVIVDDACFGTVWKRGLNASDHGCRKRTPEEIEAPYTVCLQIFRGTADLEGTIIKIDRILIQVEFEGLR